MEGMKKIAVIGSASEADRGSWIVDLNGLVFVRSSAVVGFVIQRSVNVEDRFMILGLTSLGDDPDFIVAADGLTEDEARIELVERLT